MTHVQVWVDGQDVTCDTAAALSMAGGRRDKLSQPDPVNLALRVAWPMNRALPVYGSTVNVAGWPPGHKDRAVALFTGHVTDIAYEDGTVSLLAVDPMRVLDGLPVGDTPWLQQQWYRRIQAVWDAIRTAAGQPAWMPTGSDLTAGHIAGELQKMYVFNRDVDRQPGLQLLYHYLNSYGYAAGFIPDPNSANVAQPPDQWRPTVRLVPGSWVTELVGQLVPDCMISAEPIPRLWQATASVVNDWTIKTLDTINVDADGKPTTRTYHARSVQSQTLFGPRAGTQDTELLAADAAQLPDGSTPPGYTTGQALADWWLARTAFPAWCLDNVQVLVTPDTIAAAGQASALAMWTHLLKNGLGLPGVWFLTEQFPSGSVVSGNNMWVAESVQVDWSPDGWTITLNASPPSLYMGAKPPTDFRNSYGQVLRAHPTYTALLAAHPTYADLLATPHPHPTGA